MQLNSKLDVHMFDPSARDRDGIIGQGGKGIQPLTAWTAGVDVAMQQSILLYIKSKEIGVNECSVCLHKSGWT